MQPPWAAKAVRDCGEPLNLAEDVRCGGGAEVRPGKGAGPAGAGGPGDCSLHRLACCLEFSTYPNGVGGS